MPAPTATSPVVFTTAALSAIDTELLVIPWFEEDSPAAQFESLDRAVAGEISRALGSKEFVARPHDIFLARVTDNAWKAARVALIGAGRRERYDRELARHMATAAALAARQRRVGRIGFLLRPAPPSAGAPIDLPGTVQAVIEGLTFAEFDGGSYKTVDPTPGWEARYTLTIHAHDLPGGSASLDEAANRGRILGECTNLARSMVNEPGNRLTPRAFADRVVDVAGGGLKIETLDEHQMEKLGMGMLLGVAQGSDEAPRMIVLRHDPPGAPAGPVLGLVGKGVTFDSGGISIKPADGMDRMKDDMSGGAAVACAMHAIAALQAPIKVIGLIPAVENMPGGRAIKPGDILKSAEGKTVEVLNTDAEGRLILGDALWYARRLGATHLVDVATLTGAVVIALGRIASGIFGTPDAWVDEVRHVAKLAGDRVWPLPLYDEYREQLKSEIADFTNVGGRPAGSATAAMFLKEFTGGLPWVHMDIAGTAWTEDARPYLPKGPSGVSVRTLAELAFTSERWPR